MGVWRGYFCDAEGWVAAGIRDAILLADAAAGREGAGARGRWAWGADGAGGGPEALPYMRFLHYKEVTRPDVSSRDPPSAPSGAAPSPDQRQRPTVLLPRCGERAGSALRRPRVDL